MCLINNLILKYELKLEPPQFKPFIFFKYISSPLTQCNIMFVVFIFSYSNV